MSMLAELCSVLDTMNEEELHSTCLTDIYISHSRCPAPGLRVGGMKCGHVHSRRQNSPIIKIHTCDLYYVMGNSFNLQEHTSKITTKINRK